LRFSGTQPVVPATTSIAVALSFAVQRSSERCVGVRTNPNRSLSQQAHVRLTPEATEWCHRRLQAVFDRRGRLSDELLEELRAEDAAEWSADRVKQ